MKRCWGALALTLPALLLATDAVAVQEPAYLDERPVEMSTGRGRLHAPTSWQVPAAAKKAWVALHGPHGAWQAIWDHDRGIPLRVFGEGLPAPGANAHAGKALAIAGTVLAEQLALLAPGTLVTDFVLVSNTVHGRDGAMRTVGFAQTHAGLPVLGGQISFLFKHDRLIVMSSAASPRLAVRIPVRSADAAKARGAALAWIEDAYGATPTVLEERGRAILPLLREPADPTLRAPAPGPILEHRVVTTLVVDLAEPRARWEIYLDAESGVPLARRQLLHFGAGTLRYNVAQRFPTGDRQDYPAVTASITVDAQGTLTDSGGSFTSATTSIANVVAAVTGTRVRVRTGVGTPATQALQIADGGTGVWDGRATATLDAQLTAYVHTNLAKTFAKAELNPQLEWLERAIDVTVNESGRCNAYSTGDDIHFFVAGGQCENTGRLADVVYHEFGHSLHTQSVIPGAGAFDPHVSEGTSDYLAATMTDDPGMGRGFFVGTTAPLRHIDPDGRELSYPRDMKADPHLSGLIIAGALWDARKELIAAYGAEAGKRKADDFFYAILQRSSEMPSSYVEVLAADDDDGNLGNGTPNKCLIDRTFGSHGLTDRVLGLGHELPVRDGLSVSLAIGAPTGGCPPVAVQGVVLNWKLRADTVAAAIPMTVDAGTWQGAIPTQPDGSVVQYRVTVTLENGLRVTYPDNAADTYYEMYVGPLVPVYCTDFESDPFAAGWTHTATGAADDWEWGVPSGDAGDPGAAVSGTRVVGTDLGALGRDGRYPAETMTTLLSPVIDVTGRSGIRLQYQRSLGVEDGFYDDAMVLADGTPVWSNLTSATEDVAVVSHRDREWRFHDVDLTTAAADGSVQVGFRIVSDQGFELGGWTVDDFCIMASGLASCGNSAVDPGELCDDGNQASGDGCSSLCQAEETVEEPGGCCSTTGSGAPVGPIGLGLVTAALTLRRRRRK